MKKFIFIDIDGTLLDSRTGIPHSTVHAIREARKKGHKVFVSTGRAKSQVGTSILNIGFDGCIFSSGTVIEVGEQMVHINQMDAQLVGSIMSDLERMNIGYILEGFEYSYVDAIAADYFSANNTGSHVFDESLSFLNERKIKAITEYEPSFIINKLSFFANNNDEIVALKENYEEKMDFIIHDNELKDLISTELCLKGVTKATGMDVILDYCAASIEQTISFGDSRNDIEMIQHANLGICMGNGIEALKKIADHITDTLHNDGIYKAFEKYGLL